MDNKRPLTESEEIENLKKKLKQVEDENKKLKIDKYDGTDKTIKQIEKFQNRTAEAEERTQLYKYLTNPINKSSNTDKFLKYLNDGMTHGNIKIMEDEYTIKFKRLVIPGIPKKYCIILYENIEFLSSPNNNICTICEKKNVKYGYKNDLRFYPFKFHGEIKGNIVIPKDGRKCEPTFGIANSLCVDCIKKYELKNTTYENKDEEKSNSAPVNSSICSTGNATGGAFRFNSAPVSSSTMSTPFNISSATS